MADDLEGEIEESIEHIDSQIQEVQEEINKLVKKKRQLEEKKNSLKAHKYLQKSFELSSKDWDTEAFQWSKHIRIILKDTFRMNDFRPQQLRTINALLSKNDTILIAPTGGGKSLCFQLPAILTPGLTVVVSPLISLMEDQLNNLRKYRIEAAVLCSNTDKSEEKSIYNRLINHDFANPLKLLYITPERMSKSKRFMTALQKCFLAKHLDRFAIDEVHCCSQWGHDFRPDYKFLGSLKTTFPDIPILGVTATATDKVIMDVQKILNIRHSLVVRAPFNRPNLYYQVLEKPSERQATVDLIANLLKTRYKGMSGIIYTYSIRDTEDLSAALLNQDVKVRPYHASLDQGDRMRIYRKWVDNDIQAVVATIAFGMGIDKSDVRFVIHHTVSKSMENFYQESGRAGRDGKPAECLVLYRFQDMFKVTSMMFAEYTGLQNAYEVMRYCTTGDKCRRDVISRYFSEVWAEKDCAKMCDFCYYKAEEGAAAAPYIQVAEYVQELQSIVNLADSLDMKVTAIKLIDAWYQKGPVALRLKNTTPPELDRSYAEQIVAYCLLENFLAEDFHYTAYKTNSYFKVGAATAKGDERVRLNKMRFRDLPAIDKTLKKTAAAGGRREKDVESGSDDVVEVVAVNHPSSSNGTKKESKSSKRERSRSSHSHCQEMDEPVATPTKGHRDKQQSDNEDDDDDEIVFFPVKSSKNKWKRIYDTSDDTDEPRMPRKNSEERRHRKKRHSSHIEADEEEEEESFVVKKELILDDDIEIVDDQSVCINLE